MDLTSVNDLTTVTDKPPAYQSPANSNPNAEDSNLGDKGSRSTNQLDTRLQGAEASGKSKPIIVQLRKRKIRDVEDFTVMNLSQVEVIENRKDVILLDSTMSFEELRDVLLLRSRTRGILPADNEGESMWLLVSVSTNRMSDIVELDRMSWEAGRELLLTREDAILRLDVAVMSKKPAENAQEKQEKKKKACVIQ